MQVLPLAQDPKLVEVIELQRALSVAGTPEDMIFEFTKRFRSIAGATHIVNLDVRGVPEGSCRVRDMLDLTRDPMTREAMMANNRWHEADDQVEVRSDGLVGDLVRGQMPILFRDLQPSDDELFSDFLDGPKDGISVPIFVDGALAEWGVLFLEPGMEFDPERLRVGLTNLNLLARSAMQLSLTNEIKELSAKLEHQLNEIGRVQRSLLPEIPTVHPSLEIEVRYEPCEVAGGDYYDFRHFGEHTLGIVIADVSGHGPVAAVAMAMLRTAMHTHRMFMLDDGNVASEINRIMVDGLRDGMFVTATFLSIDERTGEIGYYNCGHCYPLVRRLDGSIDELTGGHGPPLGVLPDVEYESGRDILHPGESLVLLTDGIVETFSPEMELFGAERLHRTIATAPDTPAGVVWNLLEAVDEHAAGGPRRDDQCVLVVRRSP